MERRDFIKTTVGAGLALTGHNLLASGYTTKRTGDYDPKGLPTTLFGSTGVRIPRIVLGLGSRFCHMDSDEEAFNMLNYALDNGLYYWDTAHSYDNNNPLPPGKTKEPTQLVYSEVRVGEVVKTRRNEIFLSTKVNARDPLQAMNQIELSLKRLQTDRLDMLKIHGVDTMKDVERIKEKGNLIDIVMKMKEEKVTRFIGFSSHIGVEVANELINYAPFDSMLIAMNHWPVQINEKRTDLSVAAAKEKKMGFLLMKAVRSRETIPGLQATELVKYALSLEGPDALSLGMDSMDVVKSNIEILRNFQKMSPEKMQELALQLAPFYRHENLAWMQQGYTDGTWQC